MKSINNKLFQEETLEKTELKNIVGGQKAPVTCEVTGSACMTEYRDDDGKDYWVKC